MDSGLPTSINDSHFGTSQTTENIPKLYPSQFGPHHSSFPNPDLICPPSYVLQPPPPPPQPPSHTIAFGSAQPQPRRPADLPREKGQSMAEMREMIFRIASMQPVDVDVATVKPRMRKNVKISKDPQSVAARHRREKISERIRILQRLVPGGTKMDIASMLDEAVHYVSFLKDQVQALESSYANNNNGFFSSSSSSPSSHAIDFSFSQETPSPISSTGFPIFSYKNKP